MTIRACDDSPHVDGWRRLSHRSPVAAYDVQMPRALGLDPGLSTFGAALVDDVGRILDVDALPTLPGDAVRETRAKKRAARKLGKSVSRRIGQKNATVEQIEDRTRREHEILSWLDAFAMGDDWIVPNVIVAEAGRAMGDVGTDGIISLAVGISIVNSVAWRYGIPVVWVTQLEWRRVICPKPRSGRLGTWEQDEIVAGVGPDVEELAKRRLRERGRSITLRDHAVDAAGLAKWGVRCSLAAGLCLGIGKEYSSP